MEEHSVQLVVCDIDDTLIHKDLHLNSQICEAIRRA